MSPILLLLFLYSVNSYKILGIFPYAGKSHFIAFLPLLKRLAQDGHDVTVISHFPLKNSIKGYTDITLKDENNKTVELVNVNDIPNIRLVKHFTPVGLAWLSYDTCAHLQDPQVINVASSKFDVVLVEHFNTDCFLALVHHLKAPFIGMTSHILMPWTNDRVANSDHPAYVPNHFLDFSDKMTFFERTENVLAYIITGILHYVFINNPDNSIAKEAFGQNTPYVSEIAKNVSMILMYTHFTLNRPRPLVPSIVEVGGMHIGKTSKVPQDLEKWISGSPKGVIYFSMGSMIKGHTFPEEKRRAFLKAFSRLGQRVLWKWENETMPGKPENVMIQKWMPQFDILCHPNVKAFISHGGLLGTTEAVHCGVPVVVMPQFGDQFTNARALEASGGGVVLNFRDVDEDSVYNALKTVLDPGFNKKAKELSERFKDRPMPPLETAIYWIEYVARHKGAHHMRTAAVGMPFYQYLLLDVIAFLAVVIFLSTYIMYKITKLLFTKIFKKNEKVKKN